MYVCMFVVVRKFLLWLPATILHTVVCISLHGAKMAATRERLAFSLWGASNDYYADRIEGSSTTLPTINDIHWAIGNTSNYCCCTVMRCSFRTQFKGAGWSTAIGCKLCAGIACIGCHSYTLCALPSLVVALLVATQLLQIALVSRRCGHRVSCIHGARVEAEHCVRSRPWLQSLTAHCCHSFCTCSAVRLTP